MSERPGCIQTCPVALQVRMSPLEPVRPSLCRRLWAGARLAAGAAIVVALVWRLGSGPFLAGLRSISVGSLLVASAIAVLTTVGAAWRWCLVARGLGAGLGLRTAVAAYYRSQFLNSVLPGGVLGDLHRGVSHGGQVGDVGRGLRAVGWERIAGQVVQVGVALAVLLALPSPVRGSVPYLIAALVGAALVAVLLARAPRRGSAGPGRLLRALRTDLRTGVLAQRSWPGIAGLVRGRGGWPHGDLPVRGVHGRGGRSDRPAAPARAGGPAGHGRPD